MHYLLAQQHAGVLHPRHPQLFAHAVPSNFRTLALLSASEPRTQPHISTRISARSNRSRPKSRSEHEHSAHTAFHATKPTTLPDSYMSRLQMAPHTLWWAPHIYLITREITQIRGLAIFQGQLGHGWCEARGVVTQKS